ncbi:S24 family peptidase [Fusibacter sp. JL216-2]|uniref:S24 family peptidase n=1 Tax=Fusibacter sp. JL216-2 TaxID=3071453 RepID=UPI003D3474B4
MNRLAEKIKKARLNAKLTEKELAKKCGLSVNYIIQIESGKKIIKEAFADKILESLGEKSERLEDELPKPKLETKAKTVQSSNANTPNIKPNAQWADALAGVIKKYPVEDCLTGKVVDTKELPVLGKKILGHHPDKIMFVRVSNDQMKKMRVQKNDVVTLAKTHEIQNGQIYLLEMDQKKIIRMLVKEGQTVRLMKSLNDDSAIKVDINKIKVIGKCLAVEFKI